MSTSDGSTAEYYKLPEGATELQDLISHRNLNAQDGEIFRAIYRKGLASHSDELRDARKVLFYAQAEVERLERATIKESLTDQKPAYISPDNFDVRLISQLAAEHGMNADFGQQNQLPGGPMLRCHDCISEHCPCVAK